MARAREGALRGLTRGGGWLALVYASLVGWVAYTRLPGMSPAALCQDDLWVASLIKYAAPSDLLTYTAPVPMGFIAVQQAFHRLLGDPELSVQILPFLCGLALIPLSGWVASRLTDRWEIGLLAAVLVALHPYAGMYSVRVKQFTWDAAAMLTLLGAALPRFDAHDRGRPWFVAGVSAAALLASFNTIFAGAVLCHLGILVSRSRESAAPRSVRTAVAAALAYDGFAVFFYVVRLRSQSADWIVKYWQTWDAFPKSAPSLAGGVDLAWLLAATLRGYRLWLPNGWLHLAWLAPIGLLALLIQRRHRWQGLALLAMGLAIPAAALFLYYPLGGLRTDYYFQSMLAVLAAVAVGRMAALLAAAVLRSERARPRAAAVATAITVGFAALLLVCAPRPRADYGDTPIVSQDRSLTQNKDLVATMDGIVRSDDLILLSQYARWTVAYYTTMPMRVDFREPREHLFDVHLIGHEPSQGDLAATLAAPDPPDRVILLALFTRPEGLEIFRRLLQGSGYVLASDRRTLDEGALQTWIRGSVGPR